MRTNSEDSGYTTVSILQTEMGGYSDYLSLTKRPKRSKSERNTEVFCNLKYQAGLVSWLHRYFCYGLSLSHCDLAQVDLTKMQPVIEQGKKDTSGAKGFGPVACCASNHFYIGRTRRCCNHQVAVST